jgi:hypothetical protein
MNEIHQMSIDSSLRFRRVHDLDRASRWLGKGRVACRRGGWSI